VVAAHESLRPAAELLAGWISRRCSVSCIAASSGEHRPAAAATEAGTPAAPAALLRLVRLALTADAGGGAGDRASSSPPPAYDGTKSNNSGMESEAYALELPSDAPGEAVITADTLAGANRGAGADRRLAVGLGKAGELTLKACVHSSSSLSETRAVGSRSHPTHHLPRLSQPTATLLQLVRPPSHPASSAPPPALLVRTLRPSAAASRQRAGTHPDQSAHTRPHDPPTPPRTSQNPTQRSATAPRGAGAASSSTSAATSTQCPF
jgi:hypothetical protein